MFSLHHTVERIAFPLITVRTCRGVSVRTPARPRSVAYLVAQDAVDQLLDALPDMRLAVPAEQLAWRPGPFHRALTALPVVFPPAPPVSLG